MDKYIKRENGMLVVGICYPNCMYYNDLKSGNNKSTLLPDALLDYNTKEYKNCVITNPSDGAEILYI